MTGAERNARIDQLFIDALPLAQSERESYLEQECAGDDDLRREVEELLRVDGEARTDAFAAGPMNLAKMVDDSTLDARIGESIGPFVLERRIASGGFGTVYEASRSEPYQERVAIKLLHRDKLASPDIVKRTLREMQVLADLRHDYIVNHLQSGVTTSGEPFIVMEYIDGQSLGTHCDERRLSINERLQLFQRICEAVEFAHSHNWIHRDLKPANVLITKDGKPKLLDFGIAKLVAPPGEMGGSTALTMSPIGTPQYMSPEQLLGDDVGKASDVYSLGIILFELVSGHRVYDSLFGERTSYRFVELQQAVQRTSPSRPSNLLSVNTTRDGVSADTISYRRRTSPAQLRQSLSGDIDNIVMMALRREPTRRYASPKLIADDIQAWLENRPVSARPDSVSYRMKKWWQRNWLPSAIAASFIICLAFAAFLYVSSIRNSAIAAATASMRKGQSAVDQEDYAQAVSAFAQAYEVCPEGPIRDSYLRLKHSWNQYLGFPLAEHASLIEYSKNGRFMCVAQSDGVMRIWDLSTQDICGQVELEASARQVCFSPAEDRLGVAIAGVEDSSGVREQNVFQVWTVKGERLATQPVPGEILAMQLANDNWSLLWADGDQFISSQIVDGQLVTRAKSDVSTRNPNWFVSSRLRSRFVPQHNLAVIAFCDNRNEDDVVRTKFEAWDSETLEFVCDIAGPDLAATECWASYSGNHLGINGASRSVIFDLVHRETTAELEGKLVGLGDDGDHALLLRRANTNRTTLELVEWQAGGEKRVVDTVASDEANRVWKHASGLTAARSSVVPKLVKRVGYVNQHTSTRLARPNYSAAGTGEIEQLSIGPRGRIICFHRLAEQKQFVSLRSVDSRTTDELATVPWAWPTEAFQMPGPRVSVAGRIRDVAVDETGRLVAFATDQGVQIWDTHKPSLLPTPFTAATTVAIHGKSQLLITGDANGVLRASDLRGANVTTLPLVGGEAIRSLACSPRGDRLMATSLKSAVVVDLTKTLTKQKPTRCEPQNGTFDFARFGEVGDILIAAGSNVQRRSSSSLQFFGVTEFQANDGELLAIAEQRQQVCSVLRYAGQVSLQVGDEKTALPVPQNTTIICAEFSPLGEVVVLGYEDGTIQLWDTFSRERMSGRLVAGNGSVRQLAFSLDGECLVTVCADGTVERWRTLVNTNN